MSHSLESALKRLKGTACIVIACYTSAYAFIPQDVNKNYVKCYEFMSSPVKCMLFCRGATDTRQDLKFADAYSWKISAMLLFLLFRAGRRPQ